MSDWPQWRGPQRNGISKETNLGTAWPGAGPRKLWSAQLGQGYSGVTVLGNRLYTMGNARETDYIHCLNADTGKIVWQHKYPCGSGDYGGPRSTPTISNGRVYTLSREGHALCLNAATGTVLWQQNLRASVPQWGFTSSPLVLGSRVLLNAGANGTALDATTGRVLWGGSGGGAAYASAVPFTAGGQSGVAIFAASGLVAVDPANGRVLWQHPWTTSYDVNAADPIFSGDDVFISSNYGKGGALLRVSGGRPQVVWENRSMKNHFNTCVLLDGSLYGNDENTLRCIDWRTGAERWSLRGIDKGGLIAADGKLLVLTGRGELVVLAATPTKLTELARAGVVSGTCWTHPTLAGGRLFARSQEGALVALDLRK
jgi:outer membrane protein assembly factor BamB